MITAFARTVILYFLIVVGLRLMGKRQIGQLEPGELVLTMMISDLATVPMQDFGIPLFTGIIPILTLLSLSLLISQLSLHICASGPWCAVRPLFWSRTENCSSRPCGKTASLWMSFWSSSGDRASPR